MIRFGGIVLSLMAMADHTSARAASVHGQSTGRCYYAFGKNGTVTSPRRWRLLLNSAKIANVQLHVIKAQETDQAHYNITCCDSKPYLGLWKSNFVIWNESYHMCERDWVVLFENDAVIPPDFERRLNRYITNSLDVIWLDSRNHFHEGPSGCCTVGMAYRKAILPHLISHFDVNNKNAIWNSWTQEKKRKCLFDWYLADVVKKLNLRSLTAGIVKHPSTNKEKDLRR